MTTLVFDTNVCQNQFVKSPHRDAVLERLRRSYKILASANTIYELLRGLCNSVTPAFFASDQYRFRIAIGQSAPTLERFLDHGLVFAIANVLNVPMKEIGMGRQMFLNLTRAVLMATTLGQLRATGVSWPIGPKRKGRKLGCSLIQADFDVMHKVFLTDFGAPLDDRATWTKTLGAIFGLSLTQEQAQALSASLDAFHTYRESLGAEVSAGLDLAKKPNDQMDLHQLFYLSNSNVELITSDKSMKERTKASPQSNRVVTLQELLLREGLHL